MGTPFVMDGTPNLARMIWELYIAHTLILHNIGSDTSSLADHIVQPIWTSAKATDDNVSSPPPHPFQLSMGELTCRFNIELVKLICGLIGVGSVFLVGSAAVKCVENWLDAVDKH